MCNTNFAPKLAGNSTSRLAANLKSDVRPLFPPFKRTRGAIATDREPIEFKLEVLAGQMEQATLGLDRYFDDIGCQLAKSCYTPVCVCNCWHLVSLDLKVREDTRLAGVDHAGHGSFSQDRRALGNASQATTAKASAAIVRKIHSVNECCIKKDIPCPSLKGLVLQPDAANLHHYSTSSFRGLM